MTQHPNDSAAEHPLFRALVLMGGALALSCGGIAERDGRQLGSGGAATSTSAGAGGSFAGANSGGTGSTLITSAGGVIETGGGSGGLTFDPGQPACPFAQWDCSGTVQGCFASFDGLALPAGCFCNKSRPLSANRCSASETFVCLGGSNPLYIRGKNATWDGQEHYQCACAPKPAPDGGCVSSCGAAYPELQTSCFFPWQNSVCDSAGNCTATSADIISQEGIICGCADIGLK